MKKELASAKAKLGSDFQKVVNACDLVPYENWKKWRDPFGNVLNIKENTLIVKKNALKPTKINDIYFKADPKYIENRSSLLLSVNCEKNTVKWYYGNDNKIRVLLFEEKQWKNLPPLHSDIKILFKFLKNLDVLDCLNFTKCKINNKIQLVSSTTVVRI